MDLRERVIEAIAAGASRRETAEQFGLSASVVIIWAQRYPAVTQIRRLACVQYFLLRGGARGLYPGSDQRTAGHDIG